MEVEMARNQITVLVFLILLGTLGEIFHPLGGQLDQTHCQRITNHTIVAIDHAHDSEEHFNSVLEHRNDAVQLMTAVFGFTENQLSDFPRKPFFVLIPPKWLVVDSICNVTITEWNRTVNQLAIDAGTVYIKATNINIHINGAILDMASRQTLSIAQYNETIQAAIETAEAQNAEFQNQLDSVGTTTP